MVGNFDKNKTVWDDLIAKSFIMINTMEVLLMGKHPRNSITRHKLISTCFNLFINNWSLMEFDRGGCLFNEIVQDDFVHGWLDLLGG